VVADDKREPVTLYGHSERGTNVSIQCEGHSWIQVGRHLERKRDLGREFDFGNYLTKRTLYCPGGTPVSSFSDGVGDQHRRFVEVR